MSRVGLGRHGQLEDSAGDPLDGLVNLFDVGIVLAVAFLIAGLALGAKNAEKAQKDAVAKTQTTLTTPQSKRTASGQGQSVGEVYRLPDGTLVLKKKP
ncbi:DUF2149 domain-containing protein [Baekduia sp.]|uniref:DUF2149 domain-containing protein n=1 Tax=Baekduia sp. TaxID=2600305 RepID=UPI002E068A6B|nr:DUF2149 domain-containing protein [Baekduia sp.]